MTGHFIPVPRTSPPGRTTDGSEITSDDVGYPAPPTNGSWQKDLRTPVATGIDGPQWVLEYWSQLNNVFDFVRVEDIAYDKRPGMGNVVYVVDSGRGTAPAEAPFWTGPIDERPRLEDGARPERPHAGDLALDRLEGDDNPVKTLGEIHQPDNIETTQTGFLLTEDPGSSQQFAAASQGLPNATTARLWYVPFSGSPQVVAKIDQSSDGDVGYDVDGRDRSAAWGAWETTGIIDASAAFGAGAFLINVQAHTLWVRKRRVRTILAPDGIRTSPSSAKEDSYC